MNLNEFLESLARLSSPGIGFKPHKHLLLLSIACLVEKEVINDRRILFSEQIRREFRALIAKYGGDNDRDRPHTPFFHLASSGFWRLVPRPGMQSLLEKTPTIGSAGELERLVAYAEMEASVFEHFRNHQERQTIMEALRQLLQEVPAKKSVPPERGPAANESLFEQLCFEPVRDVRISLVE